MIAAIKRNGWNEYVITAKGNRIILEINGVDAVNTTHNGSMSGQIGFQLHGGRPSTRIAFKDILIRELLKE